MKKTAALIIKISVSLALMYFAISRVNLGFLLDRTQELNVGWFAAAVMVLGLQAVVAALRWQIILDRCGISLDIYRAIRYTFISLFFSQVLPSTIGGDAARVWLVARDTAKWSTAIYSVLIDRVAGVFVLALIVIFGIPESFAFIKDPLARVGLLALGTVSTLAPVLFVGLGAGQWKWLKKYAMSRHFFAAAHAAFYAFRSRQTVGWTIGLSFIIQALTITSAWLVAKSVVAPFDLLHAIVLIPPVLLITTVPISIAGWGVRESAMVMSFSYSGLPPSDGLLVSALFGFATFALGIVGGLLWLMGDRRRAALCGLANSADRTDDL